MIAESLIATAAALALALTVEAWLRRRPAPALPLPAEDPQDDSVELRFPPGGGPYLEVRAPRGVSADVMSAAAFETAHRLWPQVETWQARTFEGDTMRDVIVWEPGRGRWTDDAGLH